MGEMNMFCKNCGSEIDEKVLYCSKCGAKVDNLVENDKAQINTEKNLQKSFKGKFHIMKKFIYNKKLIIFIGLAIIISMGTIVKNEKPYIKSLDRFIECITNPELTVSEYTSLLPICVKDAYNNGMMIVSRTDAYKAIPEMTNMQKTPEEVLNMKFRDIMGSNGHKVKEKSYEVIDVEKLDKEQLKAIREQYMSQGTEVYNYTKTLDYNKIGGYVGLNLQIGDKKKFEEEVLSLSTDLKKMKISEGYRIYVDISLSEIYEGKYIYNTTSLYINVVKANGNWIIVSTEENGSHNVENLLSMFRQFTNELTQVGIKVIDWSEEIKAQDSSIQKILEKVPNEYLSQEDIDVIRGLSNVKQNELIDKIRERYGTDEADRKSLNTYTKVNCSLIEENGVQESTALILAEDFLKNVQYGNLNLVSKVNPGDNNYRFSYYDEDGIEKGLAINATDFQVSKFNLDTQIFPESSREYLTIKKVEGLEKERLRYARNEIYARRGRKFDDEELQKYFDAKQWYEPIYESNDFPESILNVYEKANIELLKSGETENYILGKAVLVVDSYIYKNGYYEVKGKLCDTRFPMDKLEMKRPLTASEEAMGAQSAFNSIEFLSRLGKNVQEGIGGYSIFGLGPGYGGENSNGEFSWVKISDNGEAYEDCVTLSGEFINEVGQAYRYINNVNFKINENVEFNEKNTSAKSIEQFLNYSKEEGCKASINFDGDIVNSIEVIPWEFG